MATWTTKDEVLSAIDGELAGWEAFLIEVGEERMTQPGATGEWTFKDVVAHLNGWRTVTVAKLEAAAGGEAPPPPPWPPEFDEESDADVDRINEWIYHRNRDRAPAEVLIESREQFRRLREAVQAMSERDLLERRRFEWLGDHPLTAVLDGSFGHFHEEHEPTLRAWLCETAGSA